MMPLPFMCVAGIPAITMATVLNFHDLVYPRFSAVKDYKLLQTLLLHFMYKVDYISSTYQKCTAFIPADTKFLCIMYFHIKPCTIISTLAHIKLPRYIHYDTSCNPQMSEKLLYS